MRLVITPTDFFHRLRRQGAGYGTRRDEPRWMTLSNSVNGPSTPIRGSSLKRTVEEMQVSLNLTSLKERQSDNVDQLTSALLVSLNEAYGLRMNER